MTAALGYDREEPPAGVSYAKVLVDGDYMPVRSVVGLLLALAGYAIIVPLFCRLFLFVCWLVRGGHGDFADYFAEAMAYHHVEGMVAGHLGLALLVPTSLAIGWYVHRRQPKWLCSVQPGMRWRFLVMTAVVAAVVLNIVFWARGGVDVQAPPDAWVWILAACLSAPLQAAGEEFLYRGYLLQSIGSLTRTPVLGVVLSALVFAIMHGSQNLPLFVDRLGFGLLAGFLVIVTGGLEAAIAIHAVNNVFAFSYASLSGGVADARALTEIGWAQTGWDLVAFGLCALVAWFLGRRLNVATTTPA